MTASRTYERRKKSALRAKDAFLIDRLCDEWDAIKKGARSEQRMRRAQESAKAVGKSLLVLLAIGGAVTVMAIAPNIFAAVGKIKGRKRFVDKSVLRDAIRRMRKSGYVAVKRDADGYMLQLTEDGMGAVLTQALNDLRVRHGDTWDGQWRFVFFDIPNRYKWARDAFRQQLNAMGFYRMQESVFAYPFPCDEEVYYIVDVFSITPYVRFLTACALSHDADLRSFFAL